MTFTKPNNFKIVKTLSEMSRYLHYYFPSLSLIAIRGFFKIKRWAKLFLKFQSGEPSFDFLNFKVIYIISDKNLFIFKRCQSWCRYFVLEMTLFLNLTWMWIMAPIQTTDTQKTEVSSLAKCLICYSYPEKLKASEDEASVLAIILSLASVLSERLHCKCFALASCVRYY